MNHDLNDVGGGLYSFLLSFLLLIILFAIAKQAGGFYTQLGSAVYSACFATIAVLPVMVQCVMSDRTGTERTIILLWWPTKIAFSLYYYFVVWHSLKNPSIYLGFSDHLPWHVMSGKIADYWSIHGVTLIAKDELHKISVNYPAASYFFGAVYYCFGKRLGAVLSWLTFFQFLSAAAAQKVFEKCGLSSTESKTAFYFILFSPAINVFTLLIHRDILIIFCLFFLIYGYLLLIENKILVGLFVTLLFSLFLANLRAEYILLVTIWFLFLLIFAFYKEENKSFFAKVCISFGVCVVILGLLWLIFGEGRQYIVAKYNLLDFEKHITIYFKGGASSGGIYGKILSLGGPFLLPVILPFKLLIGLTAPFPWRFHPFELAVTQPFYSLESILRISLLLFICKRLIFRRKFTKKMSKKTIMIVILGVFFLVGGLLAPKGEVRYITPAVVLLTPLFSPYATKIRNWPSAILFSSTVLALLYFLYILVRGPI